MKVSQGIFKLVVGGVAAFVLLSVNKQDVVAAPVLAGFVEGAQALRVEENQALGGVDLGDRVYPRSELRAQITARDSHDMGSFFLRMDLVSDATTSERTHIDLREAYVKLYLARWLDVKVGRQVATWGTGDLVFANDLFAKDWEAFFTGLDDSYLKPPQDLARISFYTKGVTAEIAASQHFTPDALPDGTRLSVYNPFMQASVGASMAPAIHRPPRNGAHSEFFARVSGTRGSFEWALYGYRGFWPTPQAVAMEESGPQLYYPRLASGGASLRGPLGSFLVHAEGAAYISRDDPEGDDPLVINSQIRGFIGLEKSLGSDWTVGSQYYAEQILDYEKYSAGFESGQVPFEELRSTATLRVTKFLLNQDLQLSLFGYWGITDEDWHMRPTLRYRVSDSVAATIGASLLDGDQPQTMFGQFRDNSNIYARVRYSF
ncbi:hypothetical protein ACFL6M_00895 [Candidatus Eisenbacteria bacterium]|uniref:Porin n=1 Tax=Eiseniibacteriota bacterium TaxID=2212470 RepID=A0ABV6YIG2_UNCEI